MLLYVYLRIYLPIYMLMFLQKEEHPDSMLYKPNLDGLM